MNIFKYKYLAASLFSRLNSENGSNDHRVLMYHSIYDNKDNRIDHFSVAYKMFKAHMEYLIKHNIKVVPFGSEEPNQKSVSITFDDGFKDNYYLVAPLMKELGLPWTVFVVSDFLDHSHANYMSKDELLALSKMDNVTIGSHGHSHRPLKKLSEEIVINELKKSKQILSNLLSREVDMMSFPHGSCTNEIIKKACEIGYKSIGNSVPLPLEKNELGVYNRIAIYDFDSVLDVKNKIYGKWDWMGQRLKSNLT